MAESQSKPKLKALYSMATIAYDSMFGKLLAEIDTLVDVYRPLTPRQQIAADPSILAPMEVLFSGWGGPKMDAAFLKAAPNLKAVFYSGGSMRQVATPEFWASGIPISCALEANGYSVANWSISQILWSLRRGWYFALKVRETKAWPALVPVPGDFQSTVGIVSLGTIARRVCRVLRDSFDVKVIAYSTSADPAMAKELNVELVGLEELFQRSDVVSLHTGWLKETEGMITGAHFRGMKPGATFLNNARGAVIRQDEMIEVLRERPDIWAVLDVTWPEPPPPGSPLYDLPNVVMTPHIGGPLDGECLRNGQAMLDDLKLYLAGKPMLCQIGAERAKRLA